MANDEAAIKSLEKVLAEQKKAFLKDQKPSMEERKKRLTSLIGMMMSHRNEIRAALDEDFSGHPNGASDLIECLGIVGRAQYTIEHLEEWMKDDKRDTDPQVYADGSAFVRLQPKGVIGNIVPWNFPFDLSCGPLCEMLAAGNRVIIKPSELTPACGKLLADMVGKTFPSDLVSVVNGDLGLSKAFSQQKWDHLLYTGSPAVAKMVAREAAANLVPLTLELGGKCPAIMTPGSINERNVENLLAIKLIKNGQMCISIDTVHVSRKDEKTLVELLEKLHNQNTPGYSTSADCCGLISTKHQDRIKGILQEAKDGGAKIVQLEKDATGKGRQMPLSVIIDPTPDSKAATEEIFGPLLAVRLYDDLDEALDYINANERPLGLYVYGDDMKTNEHVLANTNSGGCCVNAAAVQGALPSMGFGGSGNSGFGRHHGKEGYLEFSNHRGVFIRGSGEDLLRAFGPPYSLAEAIAGHAFPAAKEGEDVTVPAPAA